MDSRTIFQNSSVTAFTMFRVDSCASRSMPFLGKRRRGWRGLEGGWEGVGKEQGEGWIERRSKGKSGRQGGSVGRMGEEGRRGKGRVRQGEG